jgi:hypothetical protein
MNRYTTITYFFTLLFISSCNNCSEDWHSKHLVYDIYYEWNYKYGRDIPAEKEISVGSWECGVGGNTPVIWGGIFAVGYDTSFIIAAAHPYKWDAIEKRLSEDTNSRGDYCINNPHDTIYLNNKYYNDSIYKEGNKLYHTNKPWLIPHNFLGIVDSQKTVYYLFDIRNYNYDIYGATDRVKEFDNKNDYLIARKKLGVDNKLDFSIIDGKSWRFFLYNLW